MVALRKGWLGHRRTIYWRRRLLSATCFGALLLSASLALGRNYSASGKWEAKEKALSGSWSAAFVVAGSDVNGDFTIEGLPGATRGTLSGTLVGTELKFGVLAKSRTRNENPTVADFTAVIDGQNLSGTLVTPDGTSGTWQGTLIPESK